MPPPDKVRVVVVLVAIGLLCSFWLVLPVRHVSLYGLSFTLSGRMLLGFILFGLTCTGVEAIVRGHPKIQPQQLRLSSLHWILPAALTAVAWALLARLDSVQNKVIGVTAASVVLALLIIAEYYAIDLTGRWRAAVRFSLRLVAYLLAMLLYLAIYLSISANLGVVIAVAAVSAILSLRLLYGTECSLERGWPYVVGLGALLGIISWVLTPWLASPLLHSPALVVLLYVLTGIVRQLLLGKLTRQVALEYLVVGVLVLLVLFSYAR